MENVLPEQPAEKQTVGYTSAPPPGAGGPRPDLGEPLLQLSGWWRRAGAGAIDGLVVGVPAALAFALIVTGVDDWFAALLLTLFVWLPCLLVIATLYAPLLMARTNGKTPGKMALGVRVARVDGAPMRFKRAFVREALLKWGLFYGLGGILTLGILPLVDVLWPLGDEENRALHDVLARTRVIRD